MHVNDGKGEILVLLSKYSSKFSIEADRDLLSITALVHRVKANPNKPIHQAKEKEMEKKGFMENYCKIMMLRNGISEVVVDVPGRTGYSSV